MNEKLNNQFVLYELSLQLKELGFDEPCLGLWRLIDSEPIFNITSDYRYSTSQSKTSQIHGKSAILAPLWQQAFDWFEEKHDLFCSVVPFVADYLTGEIEFKLTIRDLSCSGRIVYEESFSENEDKNLIIIRNLIQICKKEDLSL